MRAGNSRSPAWPTMLVMNVSSLDEPACSRSEQDQVGVAFTALAMVVDLETEASG